jgi:Ala-tRNA(Pro) deacylase
MLEQDELVKLVSDKIKKYNQTKTQNNDANENKIENENGYREIPHAPEGNCDKVSILRNNPIHAAAKALLLAVKFKAGKKTGVKHVLAILPGDRSVGFEKVAKACDGVRVSMAPTDKVETLLNCVIGRVPPFSFNPEVQVIVDRELVKDNQKIYFSPGRLDLSYEMNAKDYEQIVLIDGGKVCSFSNPIHMIPAKDTPIAADNGRNDANVSATSALEPEKVSNSLH